MSPPFKSDATIAPTEQNKVTKTTQIGIRTFRIIGQDILDLDCTLSRWITPGDPFYDRIFSVSNMVSANRIMLSLCSVLA